MENSILSRENIEIMKRLVELFQVVLLIVAVAGLLQAGEGIPAVGTWKLNVAESKYSNGALPKSATRTVEANGDGVKVSYEYVESDGSVIKYGYTANFDEQDSPISGSGANWREQKVGGADTIALRRLGSSAYGGALKKSGNVVMTTRTVVSKGGKVTTVTANGGDAKGQPTKNVSVWDKQ
jgi:hypothetical protein